MQFENEIRMKIVLSILLSVVSLQLVAQEKDLKETATKAVVKIEDRPDGWKKGGSGTFTFSQVALTNWAGGGQNSVAANAFINLFCNYKKGLSQWDNNLDIAYGVIRQGNNDFIKSDDRIDFTSKYGRKAFGKWNYAALLNFRTQMAPGYDLSSANSRVRISDVLAPAFTMISIGMDYKPNDNFTFFLSPLTGKITIVNDEVLANAGAFGVTAATYDDLGMLSTAGEKIRYEFGGYMKMVYKMELWENAVFTTKLDIFSNYINNPQNVDIFWDNALLIKVGKYLGVNFGFTLVYDDDIKINIDDNADGIIEKTGPRAQLKQVFGFGFSYKL